MISVLAAVIHRCFRTGISFSLCFSFPQYLTFSPKEIAMANHTLILLSDLHIGLRPRESARTRTIFERITSRHKGVPVLIAGDLTDSATKAQFRETRRLLDQLARTNPILAVPGNHDYAWKGNIIRETGWEDWVRYLGSPLGWGREEVHWLGEGFEPAGIEGLGVWQDGPCVYFGIDSGDPRDRQASARGYISDKVADGLRASLEKYAGKTRIAFLHHHPFDDKLFTKLHGSAKLMKSLAGNCELFLFGHEHEYGIWWNERGLPLTISSHKPSDCLSGNCMMITIIDIQNAGTPAVSFQHRLEVV
jgi:predicted phosphodiesterase